MTFTDFKDEDGDIIIMAKERLPSGMTVQIEFCLYAKHSLINPLPTYIQVHWEDNRRARIYKRFLQREGFEIRNFGIGNQLYKHIETD